jgi:TonB family protein
MKKAIIAPLLFLFFITGFSQDLSYEVRGKYSHPVKEEELDNAEFMSDIIPNYPANWIMSYVSTEILVTGDGNAMMAAGASDALSTEQKNILKTTALGTDIVLKINYRFKNPVTNNIDFSTMNYSATVVPETEAEYVSGYRQMAQYLKENAIDKISEEASAKFQPATVEFTVDEKGEISDAQISRTSGDQETDELLLNVINQMPKWKPAEDSKGNKVKQDFEFSVGSTGC